jgi:hypothetical protein
MGILNFLSHSGGVMLEEGTWGQELWSNMLPILGAIFAVVGAAATGYAIFLGINLAKATDESKRQQAKKRITSTLAGLFIVVILFSTMTIPGSDGQTLVGRVLVGTKNMVHYQLDTVNFQVGGHMRVGVYINGVWTTDEVEVRIVSPGSAGLRIVTDGQASSTSQVASQMTSGRARGTTSSGVTRRIVADSSGSGVIEILYQGRVIFTQTIFIRAVGATVPRERPPGVSAPPSPAPPALPHQGKPDSGNVWVDPDDPTNHWSPDQPMEPWVEPPSTGRPLQDFINLGASFLGRSGYAQVGTPNNRTESHVSFQMINNQRVYVDLRWFDCGTFVQFMMASIGLQIENTSIRDQMNRLGHLLPRGATPEPGDIVGWPGHVGIYVGDMGNMRRFGTFGADVSGPHTILHSSGARGNGAGYFFSPSTRWSDGQRFNAHMRGVCFDTLNMSRSGIWFARPFRFPAFVCPPGGCLGHSADGRNPGGPLLCM